MLLKQKKRQYCSLHQLEKVKITDLCGLIKSNFFYLGGKNMLTQLANHVIHCRYEYSCK